VTPCQSTTTTKERCATDYVEREVSIERVIAGERRDRAAVRTRKR
jgi:hypothetical protein